MKRILWKWALYVVSGALVFLMLELQTSGQSGKSGARRYRSPGMERQLKIDALASPSTKPLESLDVTPPLATGNLVFTPVEPCRILDSRLDVLGAIEEGYAYAYVVAGTEFFPEQGGTDGGCGVPYGTALAAFINIAAVTPTGAGHLRAFAYDEPIPFLPSASVLNFGAITGLNAIANGVILPICDPATMTCTYDLLIYASTTTHVIGDVMGYFAP